jgi:uncharacterized protein (TIGR03086 family)
MTGRTGRDGPVNKEMAMDHTDLLERAYTRMASLAAELSPGQLDASTPCPEWDVRALLNHVLGAGRMFTLVNAGHPAGPEAGDLLGADPVSAVNDEAKKNVDAWRQPGALDGDRTYPFGTFPAPAALLLNLTEVVVHTWDLAKATDQDSTIDPGIAAAVYKFWEPIPLDPMRASGAFGPSIQVEIAASPADRLLGYLGREP